MKKSFKKKIVKVLGTVAITLSMLIFFVLFIAFMLWWSRNHMISFIVFGSIVLLSTVIFAGAIIYKEVFL